jgi:hypothetical protein
MELVSYAYGGDGFEIWRLIIRGRPPECGLSVGLRIALPTKYQVK